MPRLMGISAFVSATILVVAGAAVYYILHPRVESPERGAGGQRIDPTQPAHTRSKAPADEAPAGAAPAAEPAGNVRYIAIGGGSTPESTEISLEQNLALARDTLAGPGRLLFAGGEGSKSVRSLDDQTPADPLLVQLGDLFQPRSGRDSRYRFTSLHARAASLPVVEAELLAALSHDDGPLLVYIAAHGEQGDDARDNSVVLWGGRALSVKHLAELHDAHPRPLRLLSASCYSGGFAELAFEDADEKRGPARAPRCGLFAGTWDRQTSGCDPDPDRRRQEGYSLHLLQALRGRDRDGSPLPPRTLDVDGDGRISLLEAHAHATVAAQSIDVPTTTSQRYLRAVQTRPAAPDMKLVPEEAIVVTRLGAELGLASEAAVRERWQAVDEKLHQLDTQLDAADAHVQDLYAELSGRLLARWPVLDDAYHPDFAPTLASDRKQIELALHTWPEAEHYEAAQQQAEELDQRTQRVEVEEALLMRLSRAYETLGLATALRARGGPQWAYYQALLTCERFVPTL
jgi:hypothetical protein